MKTFNTPKQVRFTDCAELKEEEFSGIAYNDFIICGCCGAVIPLQECKILEIYDYWVDLSHEIIGD